jgi:hypothetical protein
MKARRAGVDRAWGWLARPEVALHLLLFLLLLPAKTYALFGVGDIVYDPSSVTQMIDLVKQAQQQYNRLGSLLGVSTQQLNQLVALATALGNPAEAAAFSRAATPDELALVVHGIPGLETAQISQLFRSDGTLDVFLGVSVPGWIAAVENPAAYYRQALLQPAAARWGSGNSTPLSAAGYTQWLAGRSAEDQLNLAPRAAADLAGLMSSEWLQSARMRRTNLQTLATGNQADAQAATQARTLADQTNVQAKLGVRTNQILLEAATQTAAVQDETLRTVGAQQALLRSERDERRDAAAMLLDGPN